MLPRRNGGVQPSAAFLEGLLWGSSLHFACSGSCAECTCGVRDTSGTKSSRHLFSPTALELEPSRGTIPARSKAFVRVSVRPARRLHYTWSIKYNICTSTGKRWVFWGRGRNSLPPSQADCAITSRAAQFPM